MSAIGLDVGTTSTKGIAIDERGEVLAVAESPYGLEMPRPGWTEQDPELWWRATSEVLDRLGQSSGAIEGIGLSGQMHGLVALDGADRVLRPALLWNDQRSEAEADEIEHLMGGRNELVAATGNRSLTGFTASKLMWIQRHEPDIYKRVARLLLPKDYVRLRLCGEHATDVTDASGTLWFDVAGRRWSEPVMDTLGLPMEWLPPALESAERTGATADGIPVAAGAGDQGAGALGVGAIPTGDGSEAASVVLGTSGVVCVPASTYTPDPEGRLQVSCHVLPDAWFSMGVMLSAAGSLAWLSQVTGGTAAAQLVKEAERWPPGAEGLLFLPYLTGERAPHHDPHARGAFVGLSARHDRGALARAVLEGVAFALRDSLELVRAVGLRVDVGRVSGGGARSDLWLRILAAVLDLPLERPRVEEGAAYGAALLGGVVAGLWSTPADAVGACVRIHGSVEPEPDWVRAYEDVRARWSGVYPAVRPFSE